MKPKFDISAQNAFTVWELGAWNSKANYGNSIVVAGPVGEKLQVIYDRDPTRNTLQFLFYANPGNVLASCYVKQEIDGYGFSMEMVRIDDLQTTIIQGHPVPKAKTSLLYMGRKIIASLDELEQLFEGFTAPPSIPDAEALMRAAVNKALTEQSQQRLFWGLERQRAATEV